MQCSLKIINDFTIYDGVTVSNIVQKVFYCRLMNSFVSRGPNKEVQATSPTVSFTTYKETLMRSLFRLSVLRACILSMRIFC